jgi:very-short-patch-repair endonuclease
MGSGGCHVDGNNRRQRNNRSADGAIAALATRQGGVVSRAQLVALGLESAAIEYRVKVGRFRLLHRGVYAVGHDALPVRGTLTAALLVGGDGAALSHRTAAALWEILPSMPPFVELTTSRSRPRPRPGVVFHHTGRLDAYTRDGLPVTTPLRTLQDLAATRPRTEVERACSEALVLRLVAPQALTSATGPGSAVLARIAGEGLAPTRSELERRFLRVIRRLPKPLVNAPLGPYNVDFLWPSHRLVVEVDGARFHDHPIARRRDHARDTDLQLRGYLVTRLTWHEITQEPALVRDRVARLLSDRASRTGS